MHADTSNLKQNLAARRDTRIVEVFQNLVLRINRDSFSAGEVLKINAVTTASEAQLDPVSGPGLQFSSARQPPFL
jgi:hypothetical protein